MVPASPSSKADKARRDLELTSRAVSDELQDVGTDLRTILQAVTRPIRAAFADAAPNEWSVEVNLGFSGQGGIPFLASAEANGGVKVTLKWVKDPA